MIDILSLFIALLRRAFFAVAVVAAVVCLIDWLVRTRRLNPFGAIARFTRRTVDPLLVPVERMVVRAGGQPAAAPLWFLAFVVVGGILVLSLLEFVLGQALVASRLSSMGSRGVIQLLVSWGFMVLRLAILVRVISAWTRLSPYSKWIAWAFRITEPLLGPLRRIIPPIGMIDISPIVAYFLLGLLEGSLSSLMM